MVSLIFCMEYKKQMNKYHRTEIVLDIENKQEIE